eukprot:COSAG02_NODE_998_length_15331_cov_38.406119_6_plen_90_part_00
MDVSTQCSLRHWIIWWLMSLMNGQQHHKAVKAVLSLLGRFCGRLDLYLFHQQASHRRQRKATLVMSKHIKLRSSKNSQSRRRGNKRPPA